MEGIFVEMDRVRFYHMVKDNRVRIVNTQICLRIRTG